MRTHVKILLVITLLGLLIELVVINHQANPGNLTHFIADNFRQ